MNQWNISNILNTLLWHYYLLKRSFGLREYTVIPHCDSWINPSLIPFESSLQREKLFLKFPLIFSFVTRCRSRLGTIFLRHCLTQKQRCSDCFYNYAEKNLGKNAFSFKSILWKRKYSVGMIDTPWIERSLE